MNSSPLLELRDFGRDGTVFENSFIFIVLLMGSFCRGTVCLCSRSEVKFKTAVDQVLNTRICSYIKLAGWSNVLR